MELIGKHLERKYINMLYMSMTYIYKFSCGVSSSSLKKSESKASFAFFFKLYRRTSVTIRWQHCSGNHCISDMYGSSRLCNYSRFHHGLISTARSTADYPNQLSSPQLEVLCIHHLLPLATLQNGLYEIFILSQNYSPGETASTWTWTPLAQSNLSSPSCQTDCPPTPLFSCALPTTTNLNLHQP